MMDGTGPPLEVREIEARQLAANDFMCWEVMRRGESPELNPTNPKFQLYISIWKRLPLGIANAIGPPIARDLA